MPLKTPVPLVPPITAEASARGIPFMVVAMLLVPGMDAVSKVLAQDLAPFQINLLRFLMQAPLLAVIVLLVREGVLGPAFRAVRARLLAAGFFQAVALGMLVWALAHLPLANTIALFFVAPFLVTLFGVLFLRETIGWYRIGAIVVGMVGALIVVRPNWSLYGAAAVLPLLAATGYAAQVTVLRSASAQLAPLVVLFWTIVFATPIAALAYALGSASGLAAFGWAPVTLEHVGLLVAAAVAATFAHLLIITAFKLSPSGVLAPFQYLEIVGATVLGMIVFAERPDALTIVGTAIIVAAGLFVAWREHRRGRAARLTAPPG